MNPILTTLRAIELRAERAIDHELQTMMQEILASVSYTHLTLPTKRIV